MTSAFKRTVLLLGCGLCLLSACGRKKSPGSNPGGPAEASLPTVTNGVPGSGLVIAAGPNAAAELTAQVRRFLMEKRRPPRDLEELISAGYIQAVPAAPVGKKFVVDPKRATVTLVNS